MTMTAQQLDGVWRPLRAAAEIYAALDDPRATLLSQLADGQERDEVADQLEDTSTIDKTVDWLNTNIPEPSERAKHDHDCWARHVPCLASKIVAMLENG